MSHRWMSDHGGMRAKPFWAGTVVSATHCMPGDLIAEWIGFAAPYLPAGSAAFWFMMQIGTLIGFAATYPVNWWLIRCGIKDIM
jgi:hypothetical protein